MAAQVCADFGIGYGWGAMLQGIVMGSCIMLLVVIVINARGLR
jgi:hypothetical protein